MPISRFAVIWGVSPVSAFFGASLQVVALVIAAVCIVSAILGRQYGIGVVQIPAPRELLPRAALLVLGLGLLTAVYWDLLFGKTTLAQVVAGIISKPADSTFATNNAEFKKVLEKYPGTDEQSLKHVRLEAESFYSPISSPVQRCQIVRELVDWFPKNVDAYPQGILTDVADYRKNSEATRALVICDNQLKQIGALIDAVAKTVAAAPPRSDARRSTRADEGRAIRRPTPEINTGGNVSEQTAKRVLAAVTLAKDEGWMYVGFRNRNDSALVADRRIAVLNAPREGIVTTIADSQLLNTDDPSKSLGTVKGYVRAGSAVEIYKIAQSKHVTGKDWTGYDVYALVRVAAATTSAVAVSTVPPTQEPQVPTFAKCGRLPSTSGTLFAYCNETSPTRFGEYLLQAYIVRDSHSTGIHFRNIGPRAVMLSIYPNCPIADACPTVTNALLPPAVSPRDGGNDYIYTAATLKPFNFGWTARVTPGSTATVAAVTVTPRPIRSASPAPGMQLQDAVAAFSNHVNGQFMTTGYQGAVTHRAEVTINSCNLTSTVTDKASRGGGGYAPSTGSIAELDKNDIEIVPLQNWLSGATVYHVDAFTANRSKTVHWTGNWTAPFDLNDDHFWIGQSGTAAAAARTITLLRAVITSCRG